MNNKKKDEIAKALCNQNLLYLSECGLGVSDGVAILIDAFSMNVACLISVPKIPIHEVNDSIDEIIPQVSALIKEYYKQAKDNDLNEEIKKLI